MASGSGCPSERTPAARSMAAARMLALAGGLTSASIAACTATRDGPAPPAREAVSAPEGARPLPSSAPTLSSSTSTASASAASSASALPTATASGQKLVSGSPRRAGDVLATFYSGLRDLSGGARQKHVRIMWLGDSHGAADFWSGSLRSALQKRFGNGGPGFVHVGYRGYRHDGLKTNAEGSWRMRPVNPATRLATGDGIFGLGGILFLGSPDLPRPTITITDPSVSSSLTWDLCYRMTTPKDELRVSATGSPDVAVKAVEKEAPFSTRATAATAAAADDAPASTFPSLLRHVTISSEGPATWSAALVKGFPQLCGVVVETDPKTHPGVVLDTLGINGARLTTPLAWNEAAWASELARRPPELVVLEFGTNELSDYLVRKESFIESIRALMTRVRKVRPDVDCIALAPTDRSDAEDRVPLVRDAIREGAMESGCAFWDTYTIMGGRGAIRAWGNESPPRAAKDGVHLSWRGYRELGTKLAEDILRGFNP